MSSFVTFEADSELEKSSQLSTPLSLLSSDHRSIHRKPGWLGGWGIQAVDPLGYRGGGRGGSRQRSSVSAEASDHLQGPGRELG